MADQETQKPTPGVDHGVCEDRMDKVYDKINTVGKRQATIFGGVVVLAFVIPIFITMLAAFASYRFSVLERQIDRLIDQVGEHNDARKDKNRADAGRPNRSAAERVAHLDRLRPNRPE